MKREITPTHTPTTPESIPPAPDDLITPEEAANILGISPATLQMRRFQNRPPRYYKLGPGKSSHVRYSRSDVLDYLRGCLKEPLIVQDQNQDQEKGEHR